MALKIALATTLAATAVLGGAGCSRTVDREDLPEAVAEHLAGELSGDASAAAAAVYAGETIYCGGFGLADREAGRGVDCDTGFDVGSLTKQFTAAAVLRLEEAGRWSTSDRVGEHLPELGTTKGEITLHQLLTHTSGLVDVLGEDDDPVGREEFLELAAQSEPERRPGEGFSYSNVGYSLLALALERVCGLDYESCLRRELFGPAGMDATGYALPEWESRTVAVQYDVEGEPRGRPTEQVWDEDGPYWNLRGNGGHISSAADMAAWGTALVRGTALSAASTTRLCRPHAPEDDSEESWYGYGWVVSESGGDPAAWHNGGNGRSYAEAWFDPEAGHFVYWSTAAADSDLEDSDLAWELGGLLRSAR